MSIWNDPKISFKDFAQYLSNIQSPIKQEIWDTCASITDKYDHLTAILIHHLTSCITAKNASANPQQMQLIENATLITNWIFENKKTVVFQENNDNKQNSSNIDINEYMNDLHIWINECCEPLQYYIDNKSSTTDNDSQEIARRHPSLAFLFKEKFVDNKKQQLMENASTNVKKRRPKSSEIAQIRKSRADFHFNISDMGYEVIVDNQCKLYEEKHLKTEKLELMKGELIGGKLADENEVIEVLEPVTGFISAKYVKSFGLENIEWKFRMVKSAHLAKNSTRILTPEDIQLLIDGESMQSMQLTVDSMMSNNNILHMKNSETMIVNKSSTKYKSLKKKKKSRMKQAFEEIEEKSKSVHFLRNNDRNDEKYIEDQRSDEENDEKLTEDPRSMINDHRQKVLNKYREKMQELLDIDREMRTPSQVIQLWTYAMNLQNISALMNCYSEQVISQAFVDQEIQGRELVLHSFERMFENSVDLGLQVISTTVSDDKHTMIVKFKQWGNKRCFSQTQSTPSPTTAAANNNHNGHKTNGGTLCPKMVINGVGIFHISDGHIIDQRLFYDQNQQWFTDMGIIKMPLITNSFVFKNKLLVPQLTVNNGNGNGHVNGNGLNGNSTVNGNGFQNNDQLYINMAYNTDHDIMYEMDEDMNDLLALRGWNLHDLHRSKGKQDWERKKIQFAHTVFWLSVGVMFLVLVPKYIRRR